MSFRYSSDRRNFAGAVVKRKREELKITQKALAELLTEEQFPMTSSTLCKIESGERGISDVEIYVFSKLLNIPLKEFFTDAESYFNQ